MVKKVKNKKGKKTKNNKGKDKGGMFYYGYRVSKPTPKPDICKFSTYECDVKNIDRIKMLIEMSSLNSKNSKQLFKEGHIQKSLNMTQQQIEQWVTKYRRDNNVLKQDSYVSDNSSSLERFLSAKESIQQVKSRNDGILAGPARSSRVSSRNSSVKNETGKILGDYTLSVDKNMFGLKININLTYSFKENNLIDISLNMVVPVTLTSWLPKNSKVLDKIKNINGAYNCEFKDIKYKHVSGNEYEITDNRFKSFIEILSDEITSHNWVVPKSLKVVDFNKKINIDGNEITIYYKYTGDTKLTTKKLKKYKGGSHKKKTKKRKKLS